WMSTCPPRAMAGHPSSCAGVGASNARSNHVLVRCESTSRAVIPRGYPPPPPTRSVPEALYFTDSDEANRLIASEPVALLIGFAIDQQVTVQQAFSGPLKLKERVGTLDAREIAEMDPARLEAAFRQTPAIHRFPRAMA